MQVLEPDDGSGWVKVADDQGNSGLVPASYLEYDTSLSSAKSSETGSVQHGMWVTMLIVIPNMTRIRSVRGVYAYDAQGSDELGLEVGEVLELTSGPNGGQDYGEGWWEGTDRRVNYFRRDTYAGCRNQLQRTEGNISKQLCELPLLLISKR